jgi:hypothetical protein
VTRIVVQMVIRELLGERSEANASGFNSTYVIPIRDANHKMQDIKRKRVRMSIRTKRAGRKLKISDGGGGGESSAAGNGGATKRAKPKGKAKRKSTGSSGASSSSSNAQYKSHTVQATAPLESGERIPGQHVDGLYDALRKWRAEVVDGSNGSLLPWNVLNNQTLAEISKKVPLSLQELGLRGGIGKRKQEAYGNGVLRVIVTFLQDNQVQLTGGLSIPSLPAAGGGGGGAGAGDTGSSNQQSKKRSAKKDGGEKEKEEEEKDDEGVAKSKRKREGKQKQPQQVQQQAQQQAQQLQQQLQQQLRTAQDQEISTLRQRQNTERHQLQQQHRQMLQQLEVQIASAPPASQLSQRQQVQHLQVQHQSQQHHLHTLELQHLLRQHQSVFEDLKKGYARTFQAIKAATRADIVVPPPSQATKSKKGSGRGKEGGTQRAGRDVKTGPFTSDEQPKLVEAIRKYYKEIDEYAHNRWVLVGAYMNRTNDSVRSHLHRNTDEMNRIVDARKKEVQDAADAHRVKNLPDQVIRLQQKGEEKGEEKGERKGKEKEQPGCNMDDNVASAPTDAASSLMLGKVGEACEALTEVEEDELEEKGADEGGGGGGGWGHGLSAEQRSQLLSTMISATTMAMIKSGGSAEEVGKAVAAAVATLTSTMLSSGNGAQGGAQGGVAKNKRKRGQSVKGANAKGKEEKTLVQQLKHALAENTSLAQELECRPPRLKVHDLTAENSMANGGSSSSSGSSSGSSSSSGGSSSSANGGSGGLAFLADQQAGQHDRLKKVKREKSRAQDMLDDRILCVVCQDAERAVILEPCGHVCMCMACATKQQTNGCPTCRAAIGRIGPARIS